MKAKAEKLKMVNLKILAISLLMHSSLINMDHAYPLKRNQPVVQTPDDKWIWGSLSSFAFLPYANMMCEKLTFDRYYQEHTPRFDDTDRTYGVISSDAYLFSPLAELDKEIFNFSISHQKTRLQQLNQMPK